MPEQRHPTDGFAARARQDDAGWTVCSGLALFEMEQLLDWLEHCGCHRREVLVDVARGTVRWRQAADNASGS